MLCSEKKIGEKNEFSMEKKSYFFHPFSQMFIEGFSRTLEKRLSGPVHTEKYIFESCYIKLNLDCDYIFPIDLAPNRIPFGVKSTGNVKLQSKLGLI